MADNQWRGDQPATTKTVTITVAGTPAAGNTAKITVGNASVTHTLPASPTTVTVAAALFSLATAEDAPPQFADVSWSYTAGASTLTGTNAISGYPVAISVSTTGGGVTLSLGGGDLLCTGPNDALNVLNWSLGHLPVSPERGLINGGPDLLHGLATALVGCDLLEVAAEFDGGKIGLPDRTDSTAGNGYVEYRARFAILAALAVVNIGRGTGQGPSRCRLDFAGDGWTLNQYQSASPADTNMTAVDIHSATNTVGISLSGGSLGLNLSEATAAGGYGPVAMAGGLLVAGNNAPLTGGIIMSDGTVDANAATGTLVIKGGIYTQSGGAIQIIQATGGTVYLDHPQPTADGKINMQATAVYGSNRQAPVIDCSRTSNVKTIKSGSKFKGGAALVNPWGATVAETSVEFDPLSLAASQLGDTLAVIF